MDFDDLYSSETSEIVQLPDGEKYLFSNRSVGDIVRDYAGTARQFVNDQYADSLERFLHNVIESSKSDCEFCDYKFDAENAYAECDDLEAERDDIRIVVNDVIDLLKKYELRFSKKLRLTRLDVEPLMKDLHKIVDPYE